MNYAAPLNRSTYQQLARIRVREARVLLHAGEYPGTYYLSGYAVECGLKACIAKRVRRHDFPDKSTVVDSWKHVLGDLVKVAGLSQDLERAMRANPIFQINWKIVTGWKETARYLPSVSRAEARDMYLAVAGRKNGVLVWLRTHW